tara:strand:- start:3955 stop:4680 length:726 start_codon:yes stop_codon:yes gene_type:complete
LRNIKTRYSQSILGIGWAVIQPVLTMIVFTIVFGKLARINSDGVPYAIFSYTGLVPWMYFSGALNSSTGSLLSASNMLTKVYFPRLVIPLTPIFSRLMDFLISFIILLLMMVFMGFYPSIKIIYLPLLIFLMMVTASGLGMWFTAMAIQYRDINYAMGFFIQLLMYLAPVVYPASNVPDQYRLLYAIFPMTGVIEGFRSVLLNTNPMPWDLIFIGFIISGLLFISGAYYFAKMERFFADVA